MTVVERDIEEVKAKIIELEERVAKLEASIASKGEKTKKKR